MSRDLTFTNAATLPTATKARSVQDVLAENIKLRIAQRKQDTLKD